MELGPAGFKDTVIKIDMAYIAESLSITISCILLNFWPFLSIWVLKFIQQAWEYQPALPMTSRVCLCSATSRLSTLGGTNNIKNQGPSTAFPSSK